MWKASLSHIVSLKLKTVRKRLRESTGWTKKQHPVAWKEAALHSSATATVAAAGEIGTAPIHVWHGSWALA